MLFSLISNTQSCQLQWCWWSQGERLHAILITRKLQEFGGDQQVPGRAVISGGGRLLYSGSVIIRAVWKDTGQHIIVERGEVFERVHHWTYEVIVPLDLRQHLKEKREKTLHSLTEQHRTLQWRTTPTYSWIYIPWGSTCVIQALSVPFL